MNQQFCTSCGHGVAVDARFCENCGIVFDQTLAAPKTEPAAVLPLHRTRGMVSTWIMPFNAALIFGSTLAGVFDFLSPRIALLPMAASVAVTGLIVAICLRKFVAPGLPEVSKLKRALAPSAGLHRSPLLIVTGVLSALMVTGAAWSNATSASGGVIASKFDAARNAQMQLGVLHGLQKEQRVQTAVMEDIREGRAANPRRELANQGVLWTDDAFMSAVSNGDLPVVSLFLAGGMPWHLKHVEKALSVQSDETLRLLLDHPALLKKDESCRLAYKAAVGNKILLLRQTLKREAQTVPLISALHLRMVKIVCSQASDFVAMKAGEEYPNPSPFAHAPRPPVYNVLGPAPGTVRTAEQCRSDLSAGNGQAIRNALPGYVIAAGSHNPGEILLNRAKSTGNFTLDARSTAEISAYCMMDEAQKDQIDDFDAQMLRQVLDGIN